MSCNLVVGHLAYAILLSCENAGAQVLQVKTGFWVNCAATQDTREF